VGSIMKCLTSIKNIEGYLYLVGLTEKVKSIFVVTQLIKVFTIKDSVEEAVEELNNI
jgi:anti-anti-sigma regulatory factor